MAINQYVVRHAQSAPADLSALDVDQLHRLYAESPTPELETAVVARYQAFAGRLASRFSRRGQSDDDLRQVALLALVRALRRFDPGRGARFTTYALPSILGELRRHFRDHGWLVRPPRPVQEAYLVVRRALDVLERDSGRTPSVSEVAECAGVPEAAVVETFWAAGGRSGRSLETLLPFNGDLTLEATLGDDDVDMAAAEDSMFIGQLVKRLPEDQRRVVLLSFFTDLSQSEIAARLGMSQMTASRLRQRALDLLRASARAGAVAA
jgi:RNA polymerase sigma-B factor